MNRRAVLATSGMLATAILAGCLDEEGRSGGDETPATPTDKPTDTPDGDREGQKSLPEGDPGSADERIRELVAGNAGFAMNLHEEFVAGEDADNVFYSPYSISMALAMTYAGAAGDAETAMREALRFTLEEETHPAFADLQAALEARETAEDPMDDDENEEVDAFTLSVANALWGEEGYPFDDEYLDLVDEYYGGGFNEANFTEQPELERERINDWVADETEDRIEDLIPENGITSQTVLVLTNAIYFMASWEQEFDPDDTQEAPFTALDGTETTVPMMTQNLRTDYADLPRAQAIELPYVGGEVSMVLIVPDEGEFEAVESDLAGENLFGVFDELGDASGDLRMPRFEYEFDAELRDALSDLEMGAAFGPGADFSNMVDGEGGPGIDEVYHDAFVSVDEEGTEAAAATAVVMVESAPAESFDLTIDRPFLFCIRDRPTDAVLFVGRVTDAAAAQG